MPQTKINPGSGGFSQAVEVANPCRLLFCAGQIALDADGKVICAGDMRGQIQALAAGGLSLASVVRLNFYTTDVDGLIAHYDAIKSRLAAAGCQPTSTLLGVTHGGGVSGDPAAAVRLTTIRPFL